MTDLDTGRPTSFRTDFETAVQPHLRDLLAYFARRVQPQEDAADCLSETLLVLWRRADELPTEADALRAWSFGIAKGVLANQRRGEIRRNDLTERLRGEIAVQAPTTDENSSSMFAALATLRETDRELVTLIIWDGFGVSEAGALLGISPGAARTRYSRARSQLRRQLH